MNKDGGEGGEEVMLDFFASQRGPRRVWDPSDTAVSFGSAAVKSPVGKTCQMCEQQYCCIVVSTVSEYVVVKRRGVQHDGGVKSNNDALRLLFLLFHSLLTPSLRAFDLA